LDALPYITPLIKNIELTRLPLPYISSNLMASVLAGEIRIDMRVKKNINLAIRYSPATSLQIHLSNEKPNFGFKEALFWPNETEFHQNWTGLRLYSSVD
jgi:hypothetical protein